MRAHQLIPALAIAIAAAPASASFLSPAEWTPGDSGTTYQQWDVFAATSGNTPDVARMTDGTALPDPTVSATPPAIATSSGNFYSFGGPYGTTAAIPNYGSGPGTHVIVQIAASLNPDPAAGGPASVVLDALHLEDSTGATLAGGANDAALRETVVKTNADTGPLGPITVEWLIWEFFLPGHNADVNVVSTSIVHSQFREMRVDTALVAQAYPVTPIPEPAAALLFGLAATAARRR